MRGYGPSGLATVVLPRVGLRGDVLHLQLLLSGAGVLRGGVPPPDETPADAACQPETPGQPGRKARSPRPATGLPGKAPPAARDGSYFRPPPPIRQHQGNMDNNAKKAALWGGISASAAIEAAPSRHSGRLHRVWAHAAVIGPEREKRCLGKRRRTRRRMNWFQLRRWRNFTRRWIGARTWNSQHELAEKVGLMVEDVGTLEEIKAARFDPYN